MDWINYIYYNQQHFINYTRDGFRDIHEQLVKTSLMAWQNRMALDMLLAKEGGVCKIFGNLCCTFISNNTAPDGKHHEGIGRPDVTIRRASGELGYHRFTHKVVGRHVWEMGRHP